MIRFTENKSLKILLIVLLVVMVLYRLCDFDFDYEKINKYMVDLGFNNTFNTILKNQGSAKIFCDGKSLKEILNNINMSDPNYQGNVNEPGINYDFYHLSFISNFIIHTLNEASGGCFRNIGFDKIKYTGSNNNEIYDTIINVYEQKKYFGVLLRAVISVDGSGKMSVIYMGLVSPIGVDTKFPKKLEENSATLSYEESLNDGHYNGVSIISDVSRNSIYTHGDIESVNAYLEI